MVEVIQWTLVLTAIAMLNWEIFRSKRRSTLNAVVTIVVAWVMCSGVDWINTVPIALWGYIAGSAGIVFTLSLWPASEGK